MRKYVYAKVQFEATHNWPNCELEEVSYLKHEHRHVFYIKAMKEVSHSDRDIEFIMLKHSIEKYLQEKYPDRKLGHTSCEMLAEDLYRKFNLINCDVSEDNENGSIVA